MANQPFNWKMVSSTEPNVIADASKQVHGVFCSLLYALTLSPPNKLSSATFLFCFNFKSASMSLKVGENVVLVSNRLDLGETPSYKASHPDPSCLHMCLAG